METLKQRFSSRVSAFLGRTGLSPTAFGMKALGDPNLVRQIGRGRSPSLRTADRVLAFMAAYDQDPCGARGPTPARAGPQALVTSEGERGGEADRRRNNLSNRERTRRPASRGCRRCSTARGLSRSTISMCGWRGDAFHGPSCSARVPWAGSRPRWMSGSASGSRKAGVKALRRKRTPRPRPRSSGLVGRRNRQVRFVESARSQLPRTSLSGALKAGEPAYPLGVTLRGSPAGPGGGLCPLRPPGGPRSGAAG